MTVLSTRSATLRAAERSPVLAPAPLHRTGRMLVVADTLAAAVAVLVATLVPGGVERGVTAFLFVGLWLVAVAVTGEYQLPGRLGARIRRVGVAALVLPTLTLLGADLVDYPISASTVTGVCLGSAALGAAARAGTSLAARRGVRFSGVTHRVVVVGTADALPGLLERLREPRNHRFAVVAACVTNGGGARVLDGVPVLPGLAACVPTAKVSAADAVILAPDPGIAAAELQRLCWSLEEAGVCIFVWSGLLTSPAGRTRLDVEGHLPLLHLGAPRRLGPSHVLKHVLDRLVALLALLLLSPLLLVLCVAIRLDSPGPAFFRQTRVGRGDVTFTMWKLRTMRCDVGVLPPDLLELNEASGPLFKIRRDPRVTGIGRWLRRTSLDELPQLINVVMGQMSLVGPRPALPSEVAAYLPDVRHRLVVRPGITGLWQVSGRSDLPWADTVRLDQQYVDNWSLLLDVRILVRTARAVLSGRGAY